ncbi:MAG: type IV pili methyl-accepting chemotaxis transducer N-terminal domain-containing protein [Campylobacterales bacterium]|nr:type IV pili methyl-accepting chemotaxis transducer N-terminal domain-containing protein [Campylobacterales bacterium]
MKKNTISTKIKLLGAIISIFMITILVTIIHLNNKNKKDAIVINIAGKERMLTQKISKNIFYLYHNNNKNFSELDLASSEFIFNLNTLKYGNELLNIERKSNEDINTQIYKVELLWNDFFSKVKEFKNLIIINNDDSDKVIKNIVQSIYNTNNKLLEEVDYLVSLYIQHSQHKNDYIKKFQYGSAFVIFLLIIFTFLQLKSIEDNAKKILDFTKKISLEENDSRLETIEIDAEKEIVEVADTLNCFVNKINKAMDYSSLAVKQSQNASLKLEEITDEFDKILSNLNQSNEISIHLNKSEDMVIETTENLISSTKKLEELKAELDKLLIVCKNK